MIAQEANNLAQTANVFASEANVLSKQITEVSQKTYENQYVPKITFRSGASQDLTTDPPTNYVLVGAANEGYLPVMIQSIGFNIVGSPLTIPIITADMVEGRQSLLLPAEVLPGRVLQIPIPMESFRENFRLNADSAYDKFTIRLVQPTGQYFESDQIDIKDYVGQELPYRVTFPKEAPAEDDKGSDAAPSVPSASRGDSSASSE